jgi:hypothetical protein
VGTAKQYPQFQRYVTPSPLGITNRKIISAEGIQDDEKK